MKYAVKMKGMILSMTQKERNKLYIARCLIDGKMTINEAAEVLSLSERQVKRIKKGVKEQGEALLIHKNRVRKPFCSDKMYPFLEICILLLYISLSIIAAVIGSS